MIVRGDKTEKSSLAMKGTIHEDSNSKIGSQWTLQRSH